MSQAITPNSYVEMLAFIFFISMAGAGSLIGYVLAKKIRGKHMTIGSAVYWTVYLINLYFVYLYSYHREGLYQIDAIYALSTFLYLSGFVIPFLNLAYIITWYRLRH